MRKNENKGRQALQDGLKNLQEETPVTAELSELFGLTSSKPQPTAEPTPEYADDIALQAKLRRERLKGVGRPRKGDDSKSHNKDRQMRVTTIISCSTVEKIRAISYKHSIQIKDIIEAYLQKGIEEYERKNGVIGERPQGQINDIL